MSLSEACFSTFGANHSSISIVSAPQCSVSSSSRCHRTDLWSEVACSAHQFYSCPFHSGPSPLRETAPHATSSGTVTAIRWILWQFPRSFASRIGWLFQARAGIPQSTPTPSSLKVIVSLISVCCSLRKVLLIWWVDSANRRSSYPANPQMTAYRRWSPLRQTVCNRHRFGHRVSHIFESWSLCWSYFRTCQNDGSVANRARQRGFCFRGGPGLHSEFANHLLYFVSACSSADLRCRLNPSFFQRP